MDEGGGTLDLHDVYNAADGDDQRLIIWARRPDFATDAHPPAVPVNFFEDAGGPPD